MIDYNYPLYRPPAEADNIIIQATYGCSYNNCSFCSMYKSKNYEVRDIKTIFTEIDQLSLAYPNAHRVFLADGDALSLPTDYLVKLLDYLAKAFVRLSRVSVYATAQNLLAKSEDALVLLQQKKLSLIYFGIETGNDEVLKKIHKGVNTEDMILALNKASKAKIKISATVILGMGGQEYSKKHIEDTAKLINQTTLNYLSTLQLGLAEDVKEKFLKHFNNTFIMLNDNELLKEQEAFIEALEPPNRVIFRSNHASNTLHLAGTLPKDKVKLLSQIREAQTIGESALVPHAFRGF